MDKKEDLDFRQIMSLSDVAALFRRSKRLLWITTSFFAFLGLLFALTRPVQYKAEATFREKSTRAGTGSAIPLMHLLSGEVGFGTAENEAKSMLKSRKLLEEVVIRLNLQGRLSREEDKEGFGKVAFYHLKSAWAAFKNSPFPLPPLGSLMPFQLDAIHYEGEIPLHFIVDLKETGEYTLFEKGQKAVGSGKLGAPCQCQGASFTLIALQESPSPEPFYLDVSPLPKAAKELADHLIVENDKEDKGVLRIFYRDRDRHMASKLVNEIMESYQNYLKEYKDRLSQTQLDYLHTRQQQLAQNLTDQMQRHAHFLAHDLFSSGFVNSEKEMEFLAHSQHDYKEKLLGNELEIKRLESMQPENYVYYDAYVRHGGDSAVINSLLQEIRELKQRRDGLEIELQKKSASNSVGFQEAFNTQMVELKGVQLNVKEIQDIMDRFRQHLPPDASSQLIQDPRFLIQGWFDRFELIADEEERRKVEESFLFYLTNLERLFHVHEKILHERLTHQQNPAKEFQGIALKVADDLYGQYCAQLIQVESSIRQTLFFNRQMEEPTFEITSLSAGLEDAVSKDMIARASQLILSLKDESNRTLREQERLKEELSLQRTFLSLHLAQMAQLQELNKQVLNEKVLALQSVSLELIHRQISLLEHTLKDYIASRLENLHQDRMLFQQHLKLIRQEMGSLPKKWMAEQLIEQEVATNRLIVEEIAKMVESKNISHNLEFVQSAPIDSALAPLHPLPPPLLLFSLAGGFLGAFCSAGFLLVRSAVKGLAASPENLSQMGHHVSGLLTEPLEQSKALKRLCIWLECPCANEELQKNKQLLLIEELGPHLLPILANLLTERGYKVLMVPIDSDESPVKGSVSLEDYLENRATMPSLLPHRFGTWITPGTLSTDLVATSRFTHLIHELEEQFDWILISTREPLIEVEMSGFLSLFPRVVMTIHGETVTELKHFHALLKDSSRTHSFLFKIDE